MQKIENFFSAGPWQDGWQQLGQAQREPKIAEPQGWVLHEGVAICFNALLSLQERARRTERVGQAKVYGRHVVVGTRPVSAYKKKKKE